MRLLIARHGEDPGEPIEDEGRGLTEIGRVQAKRLAKIIAQFQPTALVCSPFPRAWLTAEIVSDYCSISFTGLDSIREQAKGDPSIPVEHEDSKGFVEPYESYLGGETYAELAGRAKRAWKFLREEFGSNDSRVAVITHGRIMTFLVAEILGFTPNGFFLQLANTAYLVFSVSESWRPQLVVPIAGEPYV